jgi:hypothetical protein
MRTENNKLTNALAVSVQRLVRRRLIVDFFKLGLISRWEVCDKGGWITDADISATKDQSFWAQIFQRIEARGELEELRKLINAETPNEKAQRPPR